MAAPAAAAIPENWKVIEVTAESLDTLLPGLDKQAFLEEFLRRQESVKGCAYKATKRPTKIENLYPTLDYGAPHTQIKHLYLLIDVAAAGREGYGVLALLSVISLNPYNAANELVEEDMRFTYKDRLTVLPAFIDWTCSFVNEEALGANIKEKVKKNLSKAKMSVAKYITNEVSRMLYEEHRRLYPDRALDGVILLSLTFGSARPSHRRNGKISACMFLEEFTNPIYPNMIDLYDARDWPISNMYNLYLANGQEFAPGNQLYDSLLADGADLHVRIPGSDPNNFEDTSFKCAQSSKGGRRRTQRRKQKRRKTHRR